MSVRLPYWNPNWNPTGRNLPRMLICVGLASFMAGCGSHTTTHHAARSRHYSPSRYYPAPGPASDPWGPYIHEASGRFGVPEQWIRAVMRQESGGQQDVISWAGAVGLMQVMPDTYAELQARYGLSDDPFDPHNNILAGTAYLREMYDHYGAPGFLAAYNAGPNRVDRYLSRGAPLPTETVNYVAAITPRLGPGTPLSGPLAIYGGGAPVLMARASTPAGCDPDAAYNPDGPCTPLPATPAPVQVASSTLGAGYQPAVAPAVAYAGSDCDPDAAYDPTRPCHPASTPAYQSPPAPAYQSPPAPAYQPPPAPAYQTASVLPPAESTPGYRVPAPAYQASAAQAPYQAPAPAYHATPAYNLGRYGGHPARTQEPQRPVLVAHAFPPAPHSARPIQESMGRGVGLTAATPVGQWAIQVGAFPTLSAAEAAAEKARAAQPELLRMANVELPATAPFGTQVAFRARLTGLPAHAASEACARLGHQGVPCMTVAPSNQGA